MHGCHGYLSFGVHLAHEERFRKVAMVTVDEYRHVHINDVPVLQRAAAGNGMNNASRTIIITVLSKNG
jgi:hypothetical protein